MLISNKANPNSWPAVMARMMDQARMRQMASTPLQPISKPAETLHNITGQVIYVRYVDRGEYSVRIDEHDGTQRLLLLHIDKPRGAYDKLIAAKADEGSIEIFYEEIPASIVYAGTIMEVC